MKSWLRKLGQRLSEPRRKVIGWLKRYRYIILALAGALLAIAIALWITPWLFRVGAARYQLKDEESREAFKALMGAFGTVATIAAGIVLFLNFRLAESRLVTERFSKAVEQLGDDKIEVRLGGIYALERIAHDSQRDHWTVMEVLTSFIQEKSPVEENQEQSQNEEGHESPAEENQNSENDSIASTGLQISGESAKAINTEAFNRFKSNFMKSLFAEYRSQYHELPVQCPIAKDVQAALTVIGRRRVSYDPKDKHLDIRNTNLIKAKLIEADLSRAILFKADLSEADLSEADLSRAMLCGVDLSEAILLGANLKGADLFGANLKGAFLSGTFLSGANLLGADLSGAYLSNADFSGAYLSNADFRSCTALTPEQVKVAKNWEYALYDDEFRQKLGLPPRF